MARSVRYAERMSMKNLQAKWLRENFRKIHEILRETIPGYGVPYDPAEAADLLRSCAFDFFLAQLLRQFPGKQNRTFFAETLRQMLEVHAPISTDPAIHKQTRETLDRLRDGLLESALEELAEILDEEAADREEDPLEPLDDE